MQVDAIDLFYAAMPNVTLAADGSQDALIVRVSAGGYVGWGECEASPLVSIAAFITPRSHGVCQPVAISVIGEQLDSPADIHRISAAVRRNSMDVLQAAHTFSGIEMALWDVLGHARGEPVWKLLGYDKNYPKTPYASLLFGDTPEETLTRGQEWTAKGFQAVKFGWGPFGRDLASDADQLHAAREAIGDARLMVDAGQVWEGNFEAAASRLPLLADAGVTWLEEPFEADAYEQYAALAKLSGTVGIAGGEASHTSGMATNLIRYGGIRFVQIDSGRVGGLAPSKLVADFANSAGVTYVNHTFTSHLALSASLQPFAGLRDSVLCEYPASPSSLGAAIATAPLAITENGEISAPDAPGLGVCVDLEALDPYLQTVDILVNGKQLFQSP
jgi:L-alanine-DL-glutamate epimerase-like enolase superfamily enzyme